MSNEVATIVMMAIVVFVAACNEVPTTYSPSTGAAESGTELPVPGGPVDILWVIDNSGSMCQEQAALTDSFDKFANEMASLDLDFHLAVTTTQIDSARGHDTVPRPGEIQATPRPVPGWDPSCHLANDSNGELIEGDWGPVRDSIRRALVCAPGEDPADYVWTDDQLDCVFDFDADRVCTLPGRSCADCGPEDLFPPDSAYDEFPEVLRAKDYLVDGELDVARLSRDFGCAALVGTRGYGIERGLDAAVLAVSREKTGGAVGGDDLEPSAPNHGFIRRDADFGVIFVTDENDCSHDGTLDVGTTCGPAECAYAGLDPDGPLIDPLAMSQALKENLAHTKGREVAEDELFAASINGRSKPFEGPALSEMECEGKSESDLVPPTCASELGTATSGDRYESFLDGFDRTFPSPADDGSRRPWMCSSSFGEALGAIGRAVPRSGCVLREVPRCETDAECAATRDGGAGSCVEMPGIDGRVCDTSMDLVATGTFDEAGCAEVQGDRCVVLPMLYDYEACAEGVDGFAVRWADPRAAGELFSGASVELRVRIE